MDTARAHGVGLPQPAAVKLTMVDTRHQGSLVGRHFQAQAACTPGDVTAFLAAQLRIACSRIGSDAQERHVSATHVVAMRDHRSAFGVRHGSSENSEKPDDQIMHSLRWLPRSPRCRRKATGIDQESPIGWNAEWSRCAIIRDLPLAALPRAASQTVARRNAPYPNQEQKQKRLQINDLQAFGTLAEREGFEPSIELLTLYSLSRGAPSAARASLQFLRPAAMSVAGREEYRVTGANVNPL